MADALEHQKYKLSDNSLDLLEDQKVRDQFITATSDHKSNSNQHHFNVADSKVKCPSGALEHSDYSNEERTNISYRMQKGEPETVTSEGVMLPDKQGVNLEESKVKNHPGSATCDEGNNYSEEARIKEAHRLHRGQSEAATSEFVTFSDKQRYNNADSKVEGPSGNVTIEHGRYSMEAGTEEIYRKQKSRSRTVTSEDVMIPDKQSVNGGFINVKCQTAGKTCQSKHISSEGKSVDDAADSKVSDEYGTRMSDHVTHTGQTGGKMAVRKNNSEYEQATCEHAVYYIDQPRNGENSKKRKDKSGRAISENTTDHSDQSSVISSMSRDCRAIKVTSSTDPVTIVSRDGQAQAMATGNRCQTRVNQNGSVSAVAVGTERVVAVANSTGKRGAFAMAVCKVDETPKAHDNPFQGFLSCFIRKPTK